MGWMGMGWIDGVGQGGRGQNGMGMEWDGVGVERMGWGGWDGMAAYGLGVYGMGAYGKGAYGIGRGDPWLHGWSVTSPPCAHPQVRRAIQQMLFHGKNFSWIRHVAIAVVLLTFINLLVIFAPSILGIFGMIGEQQRWHPAPPTCPPPAAPSPIPVPPGLLPRAGQDPAGAAGLTLPSPSPSAAGATSAPCLIFIFPAIFYIRIMPKDKEPLRSTPKILVSPGPPPLGAGGGGRARGRGPALASQGCATLPSPAG